MDFTPLERSGYLLLSTMCMCMLCNYVDIHMYMHIHPYIHTKNMLFLNYMKKKGTKIEWFYFCICILNSKEK